MKINHSLITNASALDKIPESGAPATGSRAAISGWSKPDRLQLSSLTSFLSASHPDAAQRSAAVAKLSAAISSGQYRVDAQQVSHKLIEEHLAA